MNYKWLFFLGAIFFLSTSVSGQLAPNCDSILCNSLASGKYLFFYSKKDIEKKFLKFLKNKYEFNLEMVEPNQEFNKTDLHVTDFPNKRLILIGKGEVKTNFILYESGGNALYTVCIIYQKIGNNKYPSIDDVPDADIKKAIRAAIAEWEEKYTSRQ